MKFIQEGKMISLIAHCIFFHQWCFRVIELFYQQVLIKNSCFLLPTYSVLQMKNLKPEFLQKFNQTLFAIFCSCLQQPVMSWFFYSFIRSCAVFLHALSGCNVYYAVNLSAFSEMTKYLLILRICLDKSSLPIAGLN